MAKIFGKRVWALLKKIPKGKVATYKQIAIALGEPNAARAVGNACNKNQNLGLCPCFRVVRSNGDVGNYKIGRSKKIKRLEKDNIVVKNGKIDLNRYMHYFKQ